MPKPAGRIRFEAKLQRPATPIGADWAFLLLPSVASKQLPTRSMVSVDGTLAGSPFQATLEPDGAGGHWLKVGAELLAASAVAAGQAVALDIAPMAKEPEPKLPDDLRQALSVHPAAKAVWDDVTAVARRDWIAWITSGKKAETRVKRIAVAIDKLAAGQRRACCFDRSGKFGGGFCVPEAAE